MEFVIFNLELAISRKRYLYKRVYKPLSTGRENKFSTVPFILSVSAFYKREKSFEENGLSAGVGRQRLPTINKNHTTTLGWCGYTR